MLQCRYLEPWEDSPSDSSRTQGWSPCELPYNLFGSSFLLPLLQASLGSTRTIQHHHICLASLALLLGAVVPFCHHSLQIVKNAIVATYVFFLLWWVCMWEFIAIIYPFPCPHCFFSLQAVGYLDRVVHALEKKWPSHRGGGIDQWDLESFLLGIR